MKPATKNELIDASDSFRKEQQTDSLWYKDAIIYQLHVKAFYDANADGVGDFAGLTQKLDYIQELGVTAVWLLPFYPSPMRDDGYDIADYRNVYRDYGTLAEFRQFLKEAHQRGIKVITELVINHTSDQHPWFQAARRASPQSSKRHFYVWNHTNQKYANARIIFTDTEKSNWAWDDVAQTYYWHRFFSHQPDLNFDNPRVLKAILRVMRFWLDQGVDGLRLDAIPYLIEREGTSCENLPETHELIKKIRAEIDSHYQGRMLLAEANQWPEDVRDYFGEGNSCHMAYHFPLMPRMYMAIAQEDRHPIVEIMKQTPDIPDSCQWAIFLRNHDELTLEMVTDKERDYMYQMYATDSRARLNLGIRRRLAPLLDNEIDKIKLMNGLLLSMPGSPIIYYGDEIGMGDNIYLGDRNGVRTPMQWSPDRNAGFSRADPQRLYLPPIMDPVYGYEAVNVEAQLRDPSSLLNWMKRLLKVRKLYQAFGRGKLHFLRPGNRKILAYVREYQNEIILCVANLARFAQPAEIDLSAYKGTVPIELIGYTAFPPVGELPYFITLPGHGFYWFRLTKKEEAPAWHESRLLPEDLSVLVLFDGWSSLFPNRVVPWRIALAEKLRVQFETEILPRFAIGQRWYGAKGENLKRLALKDYMEWNEAQARWLVALFEAEYENQPPSLYFIPLSLIWESSEEERIRQATPFSVAKVRQQARPGFLVDAFSDPEFCRALLRAFSTSKELLCTQGKIRFTPSSAFFPFLINDMNSIKISPPNAQSSNTAIYLGDKLFLKGYRRIQAGINPELEVGRFLTEVAHFPNSVPLAGFIDYVNNEGEVTTLALLQAYIENQGEGWIYTVQYLERFFEQGRQSQLVDSAEATHGAFLTLMRTLGQRTAELHNALAITTGDPAFDPEPVTEKDIKTWTHQARVEAEKTFDQLNRQLTTLPSEIRTEAETLLARSQTLRPFIETVPFPTKALKIRHHGDYHLGQVLLKQNDFVIVDFEGEPARPSAERRMKHLPLRDIAGMLRSFSYAAITALTNVTKGEMITSSPLFSMAQQWETVVQRAFLEEYKKNVNPILSFQNDDVQKSILTFFLLEKALYELRYELNHRPKWIHIPLRGILQLI